MLTKTIEKKKNNRSDGNYKIFFTIQILPLYLNAPKIADFGWKKLKLAELKMLVT